jgi:3-phenylpropionate/cinnamic acid dioxygenase small subunit
VEEDDVGMSAPNLKEITLNEVIEFIWREADMLDRGAYEDWLGLWTQGGRYVVPIDPTATDFDDTLSYINDNSAMRSMRVRRLTGGQSVSASHAPRTVRTVSRFVTVRADPEAYEVRCAQILIAHKRDKTEMLAADITYRLVAGRPQGLAIDQKVVALANSADALNCYSFLL